MNAYVFMGPTLDVGSARAELDAVYLPPASEGDVYRAAVKRPHAIGIIDGYFERVPAVWHKEILWAMSQGVHVFGSASMGALRAAELAPFGMEGVGVIYESFRDGILEDDDEVALGHGPAEMGYPAHSEPMVNIRSTLRAAESESVISAATREALERIAKALFYPSRRYSLVLRLAAGEGVVAVELDQLRAWLTTGARDQKREDAVAMLRRMRAHLASDPGPKRVAYTFEYTETWDHAWRFGGELRFSADSGGEVILLDNVLDEIRLEGTAFLQARDAALVRLLALEDARRHRLVVSSDALQRAIECFRGKRSLLEAAELERWLDDNDLDWASFVDLMKEEVLRGWVEQVTSSHVASQLPAVLRLSGDYVRVRTRAIEKQRFLQSRGLENPALSDAGISEDELLAWYFENRLGREVPSDVEAYARSAGFADADVFRRMLLREFCYYTRATLERGGSAHDGDGGRIASHVAFARRHRGHGSLDSLAAALLHREPGERPCRGEHRR